GVSSECGRSGKGCGSPHTWPEPTAYADSMVLDGSVRPEGADGGPLASGCGPDFPGRQERERFLDCPDRGGKAGRGVLGQSRCRPYGRPKGDRGSGDA